MTQEPSTETEPVATIPIPVAQLTPEEKALLREIMADKFASGPFSGMVFNGFINALVGKIQWASNEHAYADLIKVALAIRLKAKELAQ